jgi:hypothetical protein
VVENSFNVAELRGELWEWERTYDTVKPHQSLNYLTPLEFLQCYNKNQGKEVGCRQGTGQVQSLPFLVDFDYTEVTGLHLRRSCPGCF